MSALPPPPEPDSAAVAAGAATGSAVPDPQARVRALSRMVDRALHRIQQLETRITGLTDTLAATTAPAAGPSDGDDGDGDGGLLPPGARSWLLADDPAQADADLAELGVWLWQVYLWWPDAWLSSCWLWHPEVIEELWWLRVAHAEAYHPEAGSILRVADWHERHRPGVTRRVHHILGRCELNRHVPFNGRPVEIISPGPPALARHASAVSAVWTAGAGLDVVRAAGPEPTPEQLAEADAYQRALYGRRR